MTRFRFALPFVLSAAPIVAGSLGCNGSTGPALKLSVAAGATDGRCAASPPDSPVPASGISTLRVSVLRRSGTTRTFLCDRVFKVPKEHPNLKLPVEEGQNFDIVAEGFTEAQSTNPDNATHGIFRRKAVGALINVDPKGMEQKELDILRLIPTEGSTCAENTLSQSRAFHTATKLPGQVLIVGGIVASSTNPATEEIGDTVQLTNSIEVYDKRPGASAR